MKRFYSVHASDRALFCGVLRACRSVTARLSARTSLWASDSCIERDDGWELSIRWLHLCPERNALEGCFVLTSLKLRAPGIKPSYGWGGYRVVRERERVRMKEIKREREREREIERNERDKERERKKSFFTFFKGRWHCLEIKAFGPYGSPKYVMCVDGKFGCFTLLRDLISLLKVHSLTSSMRIHGNNFPFDATEDDSAVWWVWHFIY